MVGGFARNQQFGDPHRLGDKIDLQSPTEATAQKVVENLDLL
jgi:hypothetical protein